jgi:oxygen-independent coproporphyrinogen-3 oxidase
MPAVNHSQSQLDIETIKKYDATGPRYTSYPTELEFHEGIDANDYRVASQEGNGAFLPRDISLYFHLPFCRHLCYYCGCNKIVTNDQQMPNEYLKYLFEEIRMHGESTDWDRKVRQLYLGGGTPTYYSVDQIAQLVNQVHRYFSLVSDEDRDYSIKIDPRTVGYQYLLQLLRLGFNRISLGVQDFSPQVQKAVNRFQPESKTRELILQARSLGFQSINVDLIFGLPLQSLHSFGVTLGQIIDSAPDRISVYSYTHLPDTFPDQKNINELELPSTQEKIAIYQLTMEKLQEAGYLHIGMDHFARPSDNLAIAQSQQSLHRNFQGYTTYQNCDLLGIGASAIGSFDAFYYQNAQDLDNYYRLIEEHRLPVVKGVHLSLDDSIRKAIINQIMCEGKIEKNQIQQHFGIVFDDYFAPELRELGELIDDKLVEVNGYQVKITPQGQFFLRNIAMIFDAYRKVDQSHSRFSKSF